MNISELRDKYLARINSCTDEETWELLSNLPSTGLGDLFIQDDDLLEEDDSLFDKAHRVGYFDDLPTPLSTEDLCYQGYGTVWKLYSACMNGNTLEWKLVGWSC